jgi:hypothetical protein
VHDIDEVIENDKLELRSEKNKLYRCSLRIAHSDLFNNAVNLFILLNTICLAFDTHPIEPGMQ